MISGIMIWNEPNNLSHWDFEIDPDWKKFSQMTKLAAERMKRIKPELSLVLGGISPIDANFIRLLDSYGIFENIDAAGIHGFPLDWNHWTINEWPKKYKEIQDICRVPVWITEVGASSFGADEVQVFGLKRTTELLMGVVENIYWYSLLDLPAAWEATTRHKEAEGSAYYRHFYLGLIRADGTCKPSIEHFNPAMGICQWFHYQDHRLDFAIEWLKKLGVRKLRTGISWADWLRPDSIKWFDHQMKSLEDFEVIVTLCFTPESRGIRPHHTSPPIEPAEFADFAEQVVRRYCTPVKSNLLSNERPENEKDSNRNSGNGQLCKFTAAGNRIL